MFDNVHFRAKEITVYKAGHHVMLKEWISQEAIRILTMIESLNDMNGKKEPQNVRNQTRWRRKRRRTTAIVGNLDPPPPRPPSPDPRNRYNRRTGVGKGTELRNTLARQDTIYIQAIPHSVAVNRTVFSISHGTFANTDRILSHKRNLSNSTLLTKIWVKEA